jgi:3-methyladenine DNA glycosylase AlkC
MRKRDFISNAGRGFVLPGSQGCGGRLHPGLYSRRLVPQLLCGTFQTASDSLARFWDHSFPIPNTCARAVQLSLPRLQRLSPRDDCGTALVLVRLICISKLPTTMAEKLKNLFFTRATLAQLADALAQADAGFDRARFLTLVFDNGWEAKELKARLRHAALCLGQTLPQSYAQALKILRQVAPNSRGFDGMIFPEFVEVYGQADWERSLPALEFFTRFGSAEFAVRPFLHQDPERALAYVLRWAASDDHHVRRLASEGCRPRLPWAMALPKFKADPSSLWAVLEKLKDDESEYVRKSVANNLNDIAKDHPEQVIELGERWFGHSPRTDWIVKHGYRSLLKARHERALQLFGFGDSKQVEVTNLQLEKKRLPIGADLTFAFELRVSGEGERKLRLEYTIDFVKANGKTSQKVFQLSEKSYRAGVYSLRKTHATADLTTRKHYPGAHQLAVVVNGKEMAAATFALLAG